jgi:ketosteroid isomerase-like protein
MSTDTVAHRLVELCRAGEFAKALDELYAEDAVSIEMDGMQSGSLGNAKGLDAIRQKGKAFDATLERVHSVTVGEPSVAGRFFSVSMGFDATYKDGSRRDMNEICVYEVRDDKIVREQFFYG